MMSRLNQFSRFILVVLVLYAIPKTKSMEMKQCRGIDLDMEEEHVMHMNDCIKETGEDVTKIKDYHDIPAEKLPCFGKCVFSKKGLIDKSGKPHKEKIMEMITDRMPKVVHDELNNKFAECLKPDTTEMIDPLDETCTTYLPMMMCFHMSFMEVCENSV